MSKHLVTNFEKTIKYKLIINWRKMFNNLNKSIMARIKNKFNFDCYYIYKILPLNKDFF